MAKKKLGVFGMDLQTTIFILIIGVIMAAYGFWKSRKPYEPMNLPLIPSGLFQFVGIVIVFLMLAHIITLTTGEPFKGRGRF